MFRTRIHVAVIVVVAKGGAAAGKTRIDAGAQLGGNVLKSSVTHILVDKPRVFECLTKTMCFDFRIDVPVHLQDIRPAIIVVVKETASPRDVLIVDAYSGREA